MAGDIRCKMIEGAGLSKLFQLVSEAEYSDYCTSRRILHARCLARGFVECKLCYVMSQLAGNCRSPLLCFAPPDKRVPISHH